MWHEPQAHKRPPVAKVSSSPAMLGIMIPPAYVLFERRGMIVVFIQTLPPIIALAIDGLALQLLQCKSNVP